MIKQMKAGSSSITRFSPKITTHAVEEPLERQRENVAIVRRPKLQARRHGPEPLQPQQDGDQGNSQGDEWQSVLTLATDGKIIINLTKQYRAGDISREKQMKEQSGL